MKPTPVPAFACCCRLSTCRATAEERRATLLAQANQRRNLSALNRNHA